MYSTPCPIIARGSHGNDIEVKLASSDSDRAKIDRIMMADRIAVSNSVQPNEVIEEQCL